MMKASKWDRDDDKSVEAVVEDLNGLYCSANVVCLSVATSPAEKQPLKID